MLKKNQQVEIRFEDIGAKGEGIGKYGGVPVFVKGTLPGDIAGIHIVKAKKNYAFGKLMEITCPSPFRQEAKCPSVPRCGGCQLMGLRYEEQLNWKTKKVADCLERIGHFTNVDVQPAIGMESPYFYRNKGQFPLGLSEGRPVIGLYAMQSHHIIPIESCLIQQENHSRLFDLVLQHIQQYDIPIYDEEKHAGLFRHILTKINSDASELMVCFVVNGDEIPHTGELVQKLRGIPQVKSIMLNQNTQQNNVILGEQTKTIWGQSYITDQIFGNLFQVSTRSFFQVNYQQMERLYQKAIDWAGLKGNETVIDLYCGIGTITLSLAKYCSQIIGVEFVEDAVKDAKENAARNHIKNASFHAGDAAEILPILTQQHQINPDLIVLDPPRKGCEPKILDTILEALPGKIIYISCDPATLARDLKLLCQKDYSIEKVQPYDFFPHTVHVETIVLLERKNTCSKKF